MLKTDIPDIQKLRKTLLQTCKKMNKDYHYLLQYFSFHGQIQKHLQILEIVSKAKTKQSIMYLVFVDQAKIYYS